MAWSGPSFARLSPAPNPVTQMSRLTQAFFMASITIWVALENRSNRPQNHSRPRPNSQSQDDGIHTRHGRGDIAHIERAAAAFLSLGLESLIEAALRAKARTS